MFDTYTKQCNAEENRSLIRRTRRRLFIQEIDGCSNAFARRHVQCAHFDFRITEHHARLHLASTILRHRRGVHRVAVGEHVQH